MHYKGDLIYRRDRKNAVFYKKNTRIFYNGNWPDIGFNELEKILKYILVKLKNKWPKEYKFWEEKNKYMYYVKNNIDYKVERLNILTDYKPIDYKSIYEGD